MSSKGVLYIVVSGLNDYKKAREALRIAEYQAGDGRNLAVMLQGDGINWIKESKEKRVKEIQSSIGVIHELGCPIFLCGASLNEEGLSPTMGDYKFNISSAPRRISQVVEKGWQLAVF